MGGVQVIPLLLRLLSRLRRARALRAATRALTQPAPPEVAALLAPHRDVLLAALPRLGPLEELWANRTRHAIAAGDTAPALYESDSA